MKGFGIALAWLFMGCSYYVLDSPRIYWGVVLLILAHVFFNMCIEE